MDLRQLLTFRTVVDKGSFSQAAEELEVSQPAVSFQIRALEDRLGVADDEADLHLRVRRVERAEQPRQEDLPRPLSLIHI